MPIVLCRIDDRLIHGQVVVGWGRPLAVDRIVLVNDEVAATPWEQDLYRMAVPREIELRFATVPEAAAELDAWQAAKSRTLLLTGDVGTMAALYAVDGQAMRNINLGGIHHRPGRRQRLPYVYLTDEELAELRALEARGARVSAQDVPTAVPVPLRDLP
ncbi:MAG TPA: PTS sugar transporter subunit IIB [Gemmatimonadales bacterium]|nr:PTS sugar transporter subunit IIB [Gemmatimonadales bacterium]